MNLPIDRTTANILEEYHKWYYNAEVWDRVSFLGIPCLKSVSDMWNYQELIYDLKPSVIVEFGVYKGGSTLYFSTILKMVSKQSIVLAIDYKPERIDKRVKEDPHIEIFPCSTTDSKVTSRIVSLRKEFPGPMFAILDSKHNKDHVLTEMELLRDVLIPGDYLIVEDTNMNGHPVLPDFGDGPMEAVVCYEHKHPNDYQHDAEREKKFGFTFAPYGFLIRQ